MSETLRLLFLGAGFSQPAGLPLGSELLREVRGAVRAKYGQDNHVERDLERYVKYLSSCEGTDITADAVDYEKFLGFLDTEHFLGLKGSDTWSAEGNESQLMVRRAIAQILHQRTPSSPPDLYRAFARKLNTSDCVYTFNYDTLLESALEAEGIPYRLFPDRYSEVGLNNTVDSRDEVVVLKLHGSIDWCDRSSYESSVEYSKHFPLSWDVKHPVFGKDRVVDPVPLTDGPRNEGDPLTNVYRIPNIGPLIDLGFWEWCPLILAPSQTKIVYAPTLRDFWSGMQNVGGLNLSIGVVGYSLPPVDEYARQALFHVFSNYTGYGSNLGFMGRTKTPIRILDSAPQGDSGADVRVRYRFADWSRTDLRLDGFTESTIEWLLG